MTETTPEAREAESAWLSVQQAHTVGDPHGFSHHAARLTAALAALSPPAISEAVEAEREGEIKQIAIALALHDFPDADPDAQGEMPLWFSYHDRASVAWLAIAAIRARTSISEVVG